MLARLKTVGAEVLEPHERAAAGLFLGFQYPVEIPGVSNVQFLREALNSQRRARDEALARLALHGEQMPMRSSSAAPRK